MSTGLFSPKVSPQLAGGRLVTVSSCGLSSVRIPNPSLWVHISDWIRVTLRVSFFNLSINLKALSPNTVTF